MPVNVRPTKADKVVARIIARNTTPATEQTAEALTWGADEHAICAAAAIWWLYCRERPTTERAASNHVLITTIAATILLHLMKCIFTQERPDRRSVEAHLHGAPFSGRPLQSFPSGHALHIGALASAASELPGQQRALAWTAGSILALARIFLLAHWTSDVAAGLALGAALERVIGISPATPVGKVHDGIGTDAARTECGPSVHRHAKPVRAWGTVANTVDGKSVALYRTARRSFS